MKFSNKKFRPGSLDFVYFYVIYMCAYVCACVCVAFI